MMNTAGAKRTGAREGVFISYARSDGERFAAALRARLEAARVPLWQDRVGLEGGRDWWLQIVDALDRVEFMVLLMTPSTMKSPTVRREWRYARQQGVCVYPVKGSPELDFGSLPRWMRDAHFYSLGTLEGGEDGPEWEKFLNDLRTRCRTRRVPFMVEDLPDDYVQRAGEFDRLVGLLLEGESGEPVAITAALRGAGGYGKTTLARAVCHDERVQDAFDDGVLWVTLGETPGELAGRVEDLIYTLSEERPGFSGLDAATARLAELLADRDLLIVIDDVWNNAHLRPFLQGGPRCARLVTTRNADTLPPEARSVEVDAMRRAEAVTLLGAGLPEGGAAELRRLASRLGEWPLLLKLVNGTLRERVKVAGQALPAALAYVDKALERRGLTFFDARSPASRAQAVSTTLGVSLEQLDEGERARYGELAVFPEDADAPLATLGRLWGLTGGLDEFDAEVLCERLARLSLLLRFDPVARSIRLHDVVRAYLMQGQGADLPALHRQLLDAHRPEGGGGWASLPAGEPYLWDNLAHHLAGAGLGEELRATAKDLLYVVNKTFARNPVAAEGDMRAAEELFPDDDALRQLRRSYAQSAHNFTRCESANDLAAALFGRLQHLDSLAPLTRELEGKLAPPYVAPWLGLPDLPHPALVRTLLGHEEFVQDCDVSPDGTRVVSASLDKTLKVWDVRTGAVLHTLTGHAEPVLGCAYSPDGTRIVSASYDRTLKVWDAESGAELLTLTGHEGEVTACAYSPDGTHIISASGDTTLKVWDALTGEELRTLAGHAKRVNDCAVSPDGSYVASVSEDGMLKVWDFETGHARLGIRVREYDSQTACCVGPDGSYIVTCSWSHDLSMWDARSGEQLLTLPEPIFGVSACAVSPDGSFVVSGSWGKQLCVWDAAGTLTRVLTGHTGDINGCAVSPDGAFIVSASEDRTLRVWDATGEGAADPKTGHTKVVSTCAVSPDGRRAVSSSWEEIIIWDLEAGVERDRIKADAGLTGCGVSGNGKIIVAPTAPKTIKMWETESVRELGTLDVYTGTLRRCAVSSDGSLLIYNAEDKTPVVWDAGTRVIRATLTGHTDEVRDCCFSPDDSLAVSASVDGTLKVWGAPDWALRHTLAGHADPVIGCSFSPDGRLVLSGSMDKTVKVWDVKSGEELRTLAGHKNTVLSCTMSPDGRLLASVSLDGELRIWDASEWKQLTSFFSEGMLNDCAWHPDGRRLMAVGAGGVYFLRLAL